MLVITERECVGSYSGSPIFRIRSMKIFPCDLSLRHAPEEQVCMLCLILLFILNMLNTRFVPTGLIWAEKNGQGILSLAKYRKDDSWSLFLVRRQHNIEVRVFLTPIPLVY